MSTATPTNPIPLASSDIVRITGADALAFAQAQFTNDVAALAAGSWQWNAWLNAQGRVRCVFALLRPSADEFLLWLPLGGAQAIRDALARFVLRAKVSIEAIDSWVQAQDGEPLPDGADARSIVARDGGFAFAQPGPRPRAAWLGPMTDAHLDAARLEAWRRDDVAAGLPWIAPALQDEFVPQALDLERLDAIRFDKGCYPGQEVAARLHFRGGNKRSLRRARIEGVDAVAPGAPILAGDDTVGTVLYAAGAQGSSCEALCVVADAASASANLECAGARINIEQ